jgi:hypothetical protein
MTKLKQILLNFVHIMMLQASFLEMHGWNLGWNTDYPDGCFVVLLVFQLNAESHNKPLLLLPQSSQIHQI